MSTFRELLSSKENTNSVVEGDDKYKELDKLQAELRALLDKGDDKSYEKAMKIKKKVDALMDELYTFESEESVFDLNESEYKTTNAEKKQFVEIATEVIKNFISTRGIEENQELWDDENNVKSIQRTIITIMSHMSHDDKNPNFKNSIKYMPKNFDRNLFTNEEGHDGKWAGNQYESAWFAMKDAERFTITRKALAQHAKDVKLNIDVKQGF